MWTSLGCKCGRTFVPIIYEAGSVHMDQHVFDQWSVSHFIWGFALGRMCMAPERIAAWKIGLLFVFWEIWENVIEVAFSTYAPGEYHGDSLINSIFDMLPSMSGVWFGRHAPHIWPLVLLAEAAATRAGFGIHSVFLGHQGSICDVRVDPVGCGQSYAIRLVLFPVLGMMVAKTGWRMYEIRAASSKKDDADVGPYPDMSPVTRRRTATVDTTPEPTLKKRHPSNMDGPPLFKL
jgi:hypothetical protein